MEEQIISFETAKLAEEVGFNVCITDFIREWEYQLPTQSLLQKWLREEHDCDVFVTTEAMYIDDYGKPTKGFKGRLVKYYIPVVSHKENSYDGLAPITDHWFGMGNGKLYGINDTMFKLYKTYEEALEKGLQEALKLIKEKKKL